MKKVLALALVAATASAADLKPQPYYGKVARRAVQMLESYHVLQRPVDDEISRRAWTNLITQFDYSHSVFLQEDLDRFAPMQTRIDDALLSGDVSFVFDVYKVFSERYADRIAFATNLLETANFDFSVKEDYRWLRKDAPWPATLAERDELWRKRVKNDVLSRIVTRDYAESNRVELFCVLCQGSRARACSLRSATTLPPEPLTMIMNHD